MRRRFKRQLLEICDSLGKAEQVLAVLAGQDGKEQETAGLLEEMQDCAIEMGNSIEEDQKAGTKTVAFLEDYCEILWECFSAETAEGRKKAVPRMKETREQAAKSIQEEFPEETEILFLPDQASSWADMEWIWNEFQEQDGCTCYLMPIPFVRENGGRQETCYEGELFPEELPALWYEDYNLNRQNPDIIFMHDPGAKGKDPIEPDSRFAPENLVPYTDLLLGVAPGAHDGSGIRILAQKTKNRRED